MAETTMSEPITRGELHEALETWTGALLKRLDERFATMVTREFLDERFATMVTREFLEGRLATMATKEDVARHANAIMEAGASQIAVIDEKYADLPARMERVERAVYKRTRRAPSRSRARPRR